MMITLQPHLTKIARHALGLPNSRNKTYRNRFFVSSNGQKYNDWIILMSIGAASYIPAHEDEKCHMFFLTREGALSVLNKGETLCTEDFPLTDDD